MAILILLALKCKLFTFEPLVCSSILRIWDIKSELLATELEFPSGSFEISSMVHPSSYMNKILLGSTQGSLQVIYKLALSNLNLN